MRGSAAATKGIFLKVPLPRLAKMLGSRLPVGERAVFEQSLGQISSDSLRHHSERAVALAGHLESPATSGESSTRAVASGLVSTLRAAGYVPLRSEEMEYARVTAHLFTLPVSVEWSKLDSRAFRGVPVYDAPFGASDANSEPAWASRLMVFHRGRGVDVSTGWFAGEKIEEISGAIERWGFRRFVEKPTDVINRGAKALVEPLYRAMKYARALRRRGVPRFGAPAEETAVDAAAAAKAARVEAAAAREVELEAQRAALLYAQNGREANWRNGLRGPTGEERGIGWFFSKTTLLETTYQDIVVAYAKTRPRGGGGGEEEGHPLHLDLRAFRNVPRADLETCLPAIVPYALPPSDRVTLRLSGLTAAAVGAVAYHALGAPGGSWTLYSAAAAIASFSTFGAYSFRTLLRWRNSSLWTHQLVTTHIMDKAHARDGAVLAKCAFDAHAQEVGVAALVLGALHLRAAPATADVVRVEARALLAEALRSHESTAAEVVAGAANTNAKANAGESVVGGESSGGGEGSGAAASSAAAGSTVPSPDFDAAIEWLTREGLVVELKEEGGGGSDDGGAAVLALVREE